MSTNLKIGIIVLGAVLIVFYFVFAPAPSSQTPAASGSTQLPVAGQTGAQGSFAGAASFTVAGAGGNPIATLDFLHAPATNEDQKNQGLYHLNPPPGASGASSYDVTYEASTQYFNISLLAEPIGQTRSLMERDLMAKLGVTEDQMCQLNYMVSVPYWVNEFYSGESLGFSFCPGAIALPQ